MRRQEAPALEYFFDSSVPNRSSGPRRGKKGAIEKQIAGKLHVITLQEAVEYVDTELLTDRFHATHNGGCAVLFNKDTFFPDVMVKSIYLHDTRRELPDEVTEGDSGWVLQGVLSRASFRRQPLSGQKTFCGHFKGAAWRCDNRHNISTIEEAFADCALPMPPGPIPLWGPGSIPGNWAEVCGILKPSESDRQWKVRLHGAFSIFHEVLGLRPTDQSCHHKV